MKRASITMPAVLVALLALPCVATLAADIEPASLEACAVIETDSMRLACYDQLAGRQQPAPAPEPAPTAQRKPSRGNFLTRMFRHDVEQGTQSGEAEQRGVSLLDSRWELSRASKLGTFNIRGYQPLFLEPVFVTSDDNNRPATPNPDNVVADDIGLQKHEAKFQISFKTKLVQGVLAGHGDLWGGYTQTSRWQVYNGGLSRPFRETNYEPEVMLVFGTDVPLFGWDLRMLGVGFNHQSNGRGKPLSRSWNRIIGRIGLERPGWTIMYRPWVRVSEDAASDDNPDIIDYLGHGDLRVVHEWRQHEFSLMLRQNFSTGYGARRFTWSFPLKRGIRGYLELFNGYGESLIDYNHEATYFGLGVTLLNWY